MRTVLNKFITLSLILLMIVSCAKSQQILTKKQLARILIDNAKFDCEKVTCLIDAKIMDKNIKLDSANDYEFTLSLLSSFYLNELVKEDEIIKKLLSDYINEEAYLTKIILKVISLKDEIKPKNKLTFNQFYEVSDFSDLSNYQIGDILKLKNEEIYKRIDENNNLIDLSIEELIKEIELEDEFEVDFEKAEIIPYADVSVYQDPKITRLVNPLTSLKGFKVDFKANSNNLRINVSKKTKFGVIFFDADVYDFKPKIKLFKTAKQNSSYIKLGYKINSEFGFKRISYKRLALDILNNANNKIINDLNANYEPDEVEAEIPLATMKIPIPKLPIISLSLSLVLNLYASGKAVLNYKLNHNFGYESINGINRFFNDFNHDLQSNINASLSVGLGLDLALRALGQKIANFQVIGGVKSYFKNQILVNDQLKDTNLDANYITTQQVPNLVLCSELSNYLSLKLKLNSSSSLLSRLGLKFEFDLFKDKIQLFGKKRIYQNLIEVSKCPANINEKLVKNKELIINSDRLELIKYHKALNVNEIYEIEFKSIPKGINLNDLRISANNDLVSIKGLKITALKSGNSIITIETKDQKFKQQINILIRK